MSDSETFKLLWKMVKEAREYDNDRDTGSIVGRYTSILAQERRKARIDEIWNLDRILEENGEDWMTARDDRIKELENDGGAE